MLDLTYLFPEEPIEEDSKFIMGQFPMPQFTQWLQRTLGEYGLMWSTNSARMCWRTGHQGPVLTEPNGHNIVADYNIGCELTHNFYPIDQLACALNKRLSFWRWYDDSYRIYVYNVSGKNDTVWFHLKIGNYARAKPWIV